MSERPSKLKRSGSIRSPLFKAAILSSFLVHAIAKCRDCSWSEEYYEIAVRKGREHAKKTGHTVDIETGYVWTLNDKE